MNAPNKKDPINIRLAAVLDKSDMTHVRVANCELYKTNYYVLRDYYKPIVKMDLKKKKYD